MCLDGLRVSCKMIPVEQEKPGHIRENLLSRYNVGVCAVRETVCDRQWLVGWFSIDEGFFRFPTSNV